MIFLPWIKHNRDYGRYNTKRQDKYTTTHTAVYQEKKKKKTTHTAQDCKGHTLNELGSIWYTYLNIYMFLIFK